MYQLGINYNVEPFFLLREIMIKFIHTPKDDFIKFQQSVKHFYCFIYKWYIFDIKCVVCGGMAQILTLYCSYCTPVKKFQYNMSSSIIYSGSYLVKMINIGNDLYRDVKTNYIIKNIGRSYIIIGKIYPNNQIIKLTYDEFKEIKLYYKHYGIPITFDSSL